MDDHFDMLILLKHLAKAPYSRNVRGTLMPRIGRCVLNSAGALIRMNTVTQFKKNDNDL